MTSPQLPHVPDIDDPALTAELRHRIGRKTVPQGALGRVAWLGQARRDASAWSEPPLPEVAFLVDAVRGHARPLRPSLALVGATP